MHGKTTTAHGKRCEKETLMKKFRVLSDLHIDYNEGYKDMFTLNGHDDVFTVLCGDTSGDPKVTIRWTNENIKSGILIAGNHLPYNDQGKTVQELRQQLADAFPMSNAITYLDVETGTFYKEVDGILFVGTTMYSDFKISHERWNPDGNTDVNKSASRHVMNDYRFGIVNDSANSKPSRKMDPDDYSKWFDNAYKAIDTLLTENEKSANPKPVVLITHHALIADTLMHNGYVEKDFSWKREFNFSSYASDCKDWLISHPSIKCYLYGHIHDIFKDYRSFDVIRPDGSKILVVNNCRGYVCKGHDFLFNPDTFVNVETWEVEQIPESEDVVKAKKAKQEQLLSYLIAFGC